MTGHKAGGIVLVDFGFSKGTGSKKRPALIISSDNYHKSRHEVIIMAITSNIERILIGDTKIERWEESGLLYPSLVTGIIRTIKDNMIIRKLGVLSEHDLKRVKDSLKKAIEF